ncbi:hypothetical protein PO909_029568 [Leuciscus waleckii]
MPSTSAPDKPNTSRQGSLTEMFESVTPYERNSKRHGEITRVITEFIAKDMMPLSTVTKSGFVTLINTLDKRYSIPSRTYFSQTAIPELYKKCKENALKDDRVSRATALCRKLVGHFSHSWKKKAALTEAQRELKLPEHNLITECPTRWGSKEMMIARVLEQAKAISQVLAEDAEDTDLTKSIKTKVLAYLDNKYGDPNIQELLDVACFLDPRFKIQYISTDNIPAIKTRLKTEMVELAQQEKRSRTETVQMPQSAQPLGEKAKRSLGSFFKTSAAPPSLPVKLEDVAEAEVNNYLMTPAIDGEDDPLAWWRVHKISYPQLSTMARKYLCVPATSAPSERLFSTGGNIVTCTRSSLKPAKVNILVFLAKNL